MGIKDLLRNLKSIQRRKHLSDYCGKVAAVDGYSWLHKAAHSCARELVNGIETRAHVDYFEKKIQLMRQNNIEVIIVFDGDDHPSKQGTNSNRHSDRSKHKEVARKLDVDGNSKEAQKFYSRCVDITPEIAYQVIQRLKSINVKYVVAPYEADAQLAYLSINGSADLIITEDSDLLVFGCKTLLTKLDNEGNGMEVCLKEVFDSQELDMSGWTVDMFKRMCILSGCDYLASATGLGLKKAHRLIKRHNGDINRAIQSAQREMQISFTEDYRHRFKIAELTFAHQFVFDTDFENYYELRPLTDIDQENISPVDIPLLELATGQAIDEQLIKQWATGHLNPISKKPIVERKHVQEKENISITTTQVETIKAEKRPLQSLLEDESICVETLFHFESDLQLSFVQSPAEVSDDDQQLFDLLVSDQSHDQKPSTFNLFHSTKKIQAISQRSRVYSTP
ncbi:hypothetical protein MIR68_007743 [Amoeboaphelidium protococcarum]|nr:hypothetical protein MIR68_007743 [Amoeboaphelidium protococcarum]